MITLSRSLNGIAAKTVMIVVILHGPGVAAHAQCMYEVAAVITGPECSPGDFAGFIAFALDENSNVAGRVSCQVVPTAAVWTGGTIALPLPNPATTNQASVLALEDPDHLVGEARPVGSSVSVPAQWEFGQATLLPTLLGANEGFASGINQAGQIVGGSNNDLLIDQLRAVIWQNNSVQALSLSVGPNAQAFDINESGHVTGWMGSGRDDSNAFIWHNGVTTDLGKIPGGISARGLAINRFGHVVGWGRVPTGDPPSNDPHAWYWNGSSMLDLGALPGKDHSFARDVNDIDQIVGDSSADGSFNRAFFWQNGVMHLLQDLVVDDLGGFNLIFAYGIDNQGRIAAYNGEFSYLLRPIGSAPGDVDKNCVVDINDFLDVLTEWGQPNSFADTDDDGSVGIRDFLNVLSNWG